MKILISGSRKDVNKKAVEVALHTIICKVKARPIILHGGAYGVDAIAHEYAQRHNLCEIILRPDYKNHHYRSAPIVRNTELVKNADICICAWGEGRVRRGGTNDTYKKAKSKGIEVIEIMPNGSIVRETEQLKLI